MSSTTPQQTMTAPPRRDRTHYLYIAVIAAVALGILVGTGSAAGQAEAVLRSRGVRPVRTTVRPAAVVPTAAGSALPASGIVFEDGSSMNGDLVILAEERIARDELAATAGLATAAGGVAAGTTSPCQAKASKSFIPCSASVGTVSKPLTRLGEATPTARSLPDAMCG